MFVFCRFIEVVGGSLPPRLCKSGGVSVVSEVGNDGVNRSIMFFRII